MEHLEKISPARNLDPVVKDFAHALRQRLGYRIKRTVLFGSRARGDVRDGSDYDVLIIVTNRDRKLEEAVLDVELDVLNHTGVLICGLVYSEKEWERESQFPLGSNVTRDGVEV